jgi:hypothetical protein
LRLIHARSACASARVLSSCRRARRASARCARAAAAAPTKARGCKP